MGPHTRRYQLTVTLTVPLDSGASRRKASLYRSITRPPPQAHQSMSFTVTQLPLPQTWTTRPRQFPTRSFGPAAAYIPPGYEWWQLLTPVLQYQLAGPVARTVPSAAAWKTACGFAAGRAVDTTRGATTKRGSGRGARDRSAIGESAIKTGGLCEGSGSRTLAAVCARSLPAMSSNAAESSGAGALGPVAYDSDAADNVASATTSPAATRRRAFKAWLKSGMARGPV
jgi:hypothetical protein